MSVSCGFYNSQNHDRQYDAEQVSKIFDGLIVDGVIKTFGQRFSVTPSSGMRINVGEGRAWFNHTWTLNDSILQLDLSTASNTLQRIDAVVLEVDRRLDGRKNDIKIIQGEGTSQSPQRPTMSSSGNVFQYPLAYISIPAGTTEITSDLIQYNVGTQECPWCAGVLPNSSTSGAGELVTKIEIVPERWVLNSGIETGENWYTATIPIRALLEDHPRVFLAERDFKIPSKEDRKAYSMIEAVYADAQNLNIVFYALKTPTTTFSVYVSGIA